MVFNALPDMASAKPNGTVYLSEQEVERIQHTVKERIRKRSEVTGHARHPRDSKAAISQATGASLMADMGTMTSGESTLPALAVGEPYPPCTLPRQELQTMQLSNLRLETHHYDFQLVVKRVSPVVTLSTRSWAMVQDEAGETERLEIVLHKTRHGKDVLESASSFVLKEPYFTLTEEGEPTLRVDHPSDTCIIPLSQHEGHHLPDHNPLSAEEAALSHKREGNAALQQGNLTLAHTHYTAALTLLNPSPPTSTLIHDLHRNRAHVNLLLGQFTAAKADALSALIPPDIHVTANTDPQTIAELNSKSYFRAATAAYNLRHFAEAHSLFQAQLNLMPEDKTAAANLARCKTRLREEQEGVYNFTAIKAALARGKGKTAWEVDAASFVRYTEARDSQGKGRGLFTLRDVAAGEVVIVEKAYCAVRAVQTALTFDVRDDRIRVAAVGLERAVVERLLGNPEEVGVVMDLYGDWDGGLAGKRARETADGPIVDVFRVHDIVARNAFGFEEGSAGLWVRGAYINHSCVPNVEREFVGDLMVVRATRDIAAGEEILHSYDQSGDYDARQQSLLTTWGFECHCLLCAAEKDDDVAVRARRRKLAKEAEDFVGSAALPAKRLVLLKAQRLVKAIDGTYDGERFKGLPRLASRGIREWLVRATSRG